MAVFDPMGGGPIGPFLMSLLQGFKHGSSMDPSSPQGQGFQQGVKLAQLMRKGQKGAPGQGGPGQAGQPQLPGFPPGGTPGMPPAPGPQQPVTPPGPMPAPGPQQPGPQQPGMPPPPGYPPAPPGAVYVALPSDPPQVGLMDMRTGQRIPVGPMPGAQPSPGMVESMSGGAPGDSMSGQGPGQVPPPGPPTGPGAPSDYTHGQGPGKNPFAPWQQPQTVQAPGQGPLRAEAQEFQVTAPNGAKVFLSKDDFARWQQDKDGFWLDYQGGRFVH